MYGRLSKNASAAILFITSILSLLSSDCSALLPTTPVHNNVPIYPRRNKSLHLRREDLFRSRNTPSFRSTQLLGAVSTPTSIIQAGDTWGNIALISTIASLSQTIGSKTAPGRLLGAPVTAMAVAFFLGSVGVLPPGGSTGCKMLQMLSLQLATPLLLLGADVSAAAKRCGPLLLAFILAASSTLIASCVAAVFSHRMLIDALGVADGYKIASALLAKNIGGGINYIAVCQSLGASPAAVAAGLCVDNIFALIYFPATSALASGKPDVNVKQEAVHQNSDHDSNGANENVSKIEVAQVSTCIAIAAVMTSLGQRLGGSSAALPVSTFLTVCLTTFAPKKWAKSLRSTGEVMGTALLYIFFATAGAPGMAIAGSVRASILPLGLYLSLLYGIHGSLLMFCRRLLKNTRHSGVVLPQRLLVASSASIGGPATAAALASSNGWDSLITPSLLVGNLGYAIATFIGVAFYATVRSILA